MKAERPPHNYSLGTLAVGDSVLCSTRPAFQSKLSSTLFLYKACIFHCDDGCLAHSSIKHNQAE